MARPRAPAALAAPGGITVKRAEVEARGGGQFRIWHAESGSDVCGLSGSDCRTRNESSCRTVCVYEITGFIARASFGPVCQLFVTYISHFRSVT